MADRYTGARRRVDKDGVRTIEGSGVRTSVWLLTLAMVLVGVVLLVIVRPALQAGRKPRIETHKPNLAAHNALEHSRAPALHAPAPPKMAIRAEARSSTDAPRPEHQPPAPTPALQPDYNAPAPPADAEQGQQSNEPRGIAVFPPPGTKPILRGIVVPEGFALPPGYVRHYQTTDDGQQLPPILMFNPDYHPLDANGNPIPLPADRVVPPDMAPPGMSVQMLHVPDAQPPTYDSSRARTGPPPTP